MKKREKKILFKLIVFCLILIISYIIGLKETQNINNEQNNQEQVLNENLNENESNENQEKLQIHFIDVGQGDCTLIKYNNETMLIDAGNNEYGDLVVDYLKKQNINYLNYIVGTHGDADHIGGLDVVINNFDFDKIYYPKQVKTTKTFTDFAKAIKNKNKQIDTPIIGDNIFLGEDVKITILSPEQKEYEDSNNYSIVLRLEYHNNSFLFMGDAELDIENYLLKNNSNIKCDLIKVGHHGSNSSTSNNFIKKVNPKYAVISVGKDNEYNHPAKKVLDRLERYNIKIIRTDISGNIIVNSDGNNISIEKERN